MCACTLILVMTVACFWIYDLIAHRGPSYAAPLRAHVVETRRDRHSTPAAIAPDMNSDAVRFANADVAAELQRSELKPEPPKAKHAAAPAEEKENPDGREAAATGSGDADICVGRPNLPRTLWPLLGRVLINAHDSGRAAVSPTTIARHAITPGIYLAMLIVWEASVRISICRRGSYLLPRLSSAPRGIGRRSSCSTAS